MLTGARGPRHVRPVDTTYAKFIGRVGALAVSLGVGVAVATTPGIAFATTDDTGAQSESPSKNDESTASAGESPAEQSAAESPAGSPVEADDEGAEEDDAAEPEDGDDPELEEPAELEPATPPSPISGNDDDDAEPVDTEPAVEAEHEVSAPQQLSPAVGSDQPADNGHASDAGSSPSAVESAPAVAEPPQPAETGTLGIEVSDPTVEQAPGVLPAAFTAAPSLNSTAVNPVDALLAVPRTLVGMLSGAISTIFSPFLLAGTAVPVQTPLLWTVLAWVRREIVHTFFNRTPEVNVVKVLPDIPGVAIFDLNENDPNCDPLTTVITDQPEFGTVVKNPDGTFTYTADVEHLLSGVTDSFTVTITDSVGTHLPGVLGHIQNFFHRIAQFVGLAKPDTIQVTVPVTIPGVGVNMPPVLVVSPAAAVGVGETVVLSPTVLLTDADSSQLSGATVTITGADPGDQLTFTGSNGITGAYADGVLTLTGNASAAAYRAVLQSVSFTTDATGLLGLRTVTWSVTDDEGASSLPGVTEVVVLGELNAPPTVVSTPVGVVTAGQSTVVSPVIVIVNEPGELLSGATVTITAPDGSDQLTFTGSGGITGSYANGVLTLSGDASAAAYQAVLQSVSFSTSAAGLVGVRTIEFAVTDAVGQDSVVPGVTLLTVIGALNAPPSVVATPVGTVTTGASTVVSPVIVIVNEPGELLSGATVTITAPDGSDQLTFTGSGGITGSYANGVLTLSGDASAAAYRAVLQSVSFSSGVAGVRTIEFSVTDAVGQDSVVPGVTLLTVVSGLNGAPTIVATPVGVGSTGQSTVVSPIIVIVNEPGELLSGATVTITAPSGSDELTFTGSGGITGSYSGGVLTLTGDASAAAYQTVLQSVALSTDAAGVRTIQFAVTDAAGQDSVLPGVTLVTVTPALNGAPTIVTTPVGVGSTGQPTVVSPIIVIVNEPGELLSGATVTITSPDGSDELTFTESGGITGAYVNGVLTLTGDASAAAYQTVLQSVALSTDVAGVRTIEFSVTDAAGQASALPGVTLLTVTPTL
ncbi:Ig-like domain-containing protein, partial [Mycolicibacterium bacteremicum]|uniref:Ig-like domain-containing protein n=1 Tax=Mycolicibacterium bacteremicum TaxID=564198 RepID=UPI0026EDABE8